MSVPPWLGSLFIGVEMGFGPSKARLARAAGLTCASVGLRAWRVPRA